MQSWVMKYSFLKYIFDFIVNIPLVLCCFPLNGDLTSSVTQTFKNIKVSMSVRQLVQPSDRAGE